MIWYRLHPLRYEHKPLHFGGGTEQRFAAPADQCGALYAGDSPRYAFVETFGRDLGQMVVREQGHFIRQGDRGKLRA